MNCSLLMKCAFILVGSILLDQPLRGSSLKQWLTDQTLPIQDLRKQLLGSWDGAWVTRALRPDAPEMGDPILGSRFACLPSTVCCGSDSDSNNCQAIPLYDIGSIQTLTLPGTYCLAEDIHATIYIEGSDITLDLNGHMIEVPNGMIISGVWVRNGPNNVVIKNGLVLGQLQPNTASIVLEKAFNVRIEDITCHNSMVGIVLLGPTSPFDPPDKRPVNTIIERVICSGNFLGVLGLGDITTTVRDCVLNGNFGAGLQAITSDSLFVDGCVCNQNADTSNGSGFSLQQATSVELVNCVANQNDDQGFNISGSTDVVLRNCYAIENAHTGFNISGNASDVAFFDCIAEGNGADGFALFGDSASFFNCTATFNGQSNNNNGFNIFPNVTALVQGCTAESNFGYGFNSNNFTNQFYSNVACDNGSGNYNGINPTLISSPANVRGVHNADCADVTPDQIEEILALLGGPTCNAIPIDDTGADQTITVPGRYYLIADLSNKITIQVSGVILDLNAHTIDIPLGADGIVVDSVSDVQIRNGFIDGNSNANRGIFLNVASDVRIDDITCISCSVGISMESSTRTTLNRVYCATHSGAGILCSTSEELQIFDSCLVGNGAGGLACTDSNLLYIRGCRANLNSLAGIFLDTCTHAEIDDCVLFQTSVGVSIEDSDDVIIHSCFACANSGAGFNLQSATETVLIYNSFGLSNGAEGFFVDGAVKNSVIRECTANNNVTGFSNIVAGTCLFYANSACNNGTNYLGVFSAPVGGADCAEYWYNIDCDFVCP